MTIKTVAEQPSTSAGDHAARLDLARLSLEGLSVGDAFGERFFGEPAKAVARIAARELVPGPWGWTDDTAMALSIVETLAAHQGIDRDGLAKAFARRYWAEPARGYGRGAHQILQAMNEGLSWQHAAATVFDGQGSYGNGGAMRSAPIGAYFWDDYDLVVRHASASAEPTHAHPEGRAGAIAIAVAAAVAVRMGRGDLEPSAAILFRTVLLHCPPGLTRDGIEKAQGIPFAAEVPAVAAVLGNGGEVSSQDTVPLCIWAAARHLDNYEESLWSTVAALGDRDTTCAIVGGIVVQVVGLPGIPARWLAAREPLPR